MQETTENGTAATPVRTTPFMGDTDVSVALFSWHHFSHDQIKEIEEMTGRTFSDISDLSDLASESIEGAQDVDEVWSQLHSRIGTLVEEVDAVAIFGVFPPPIRARILKWSTRHGSPNLYLFESFNRRSDRSNKGPDFNHLAWLKTGEYNLNLLSQ